MSALPYLPLLLAWAVAVVSPGPDFLAVLRTSAGGSRRAGVLVACGVVTGIACWAVAALAGLTALLARYEHLYLALRLAGAAFLIVYGLTTLRSAWRRAPEAAEPPEAAERPERMARRSARPAGSAPAGAGWRGWRLGLLTNLSNPKAVIFFGALFAGLLPPSASTAARVEVLLAMLAVALGWFTAVAALASVPAATAAYRRGRRVLDLVTGGLFVAVGGALARP
ncbi:MAG TPA: LysE family transporter [Pseudonocardia sp.]|jgi:threonine/homoserine/homoserine lactone efflux protein